MRNWSGIKAHRGVFFRICFCKSNSYNPNIVISTNPVKASYHSVYSSYIETDW